MEQHGGPVSKAFVSEGFEPRAPAIQAAIEAGRRALLEAGRLLEECRSALVKPTLCFLGNHDKATANLAVVDGVIELLQGCGILDVAIGERRAVGMDTREVFEATGIADIARRRGVRLVDLN
jgi:uncharacterized protein (DUF362 family)